MKKTLYIHQEYRLQPKKHAWGSAKTGKRAAYRAPSSIKGVGKIYVITMHGKILYVGRTSQGAGNRLRQRWKAKGKNGDHGYTWNRLYLPPPLSGPFKRLVRCFSF